MGWYPVISLSVSRTSLGLIPLTLTDSGRVGNVIVAWNPNLPEREVTWAKSRWLDGGSVVSSRDDVTGADLTFQIWGASAGALWTTADLWDEALAQFSYTVTETRSGSLTPIVYDCAPTSLRIVNDPVTIRAGFLVASCTIPRQP